MNCICIENNHNNSNFTVGRKYEYKEEGYIRTNWGGMWAKSHEPFKIINNVFECGLCKFKINKQNDDVLEGDTE